MNLFKPFKIALRWLIGVEKDDILTPFERKLFAGDCNWAECKLCQTLASDIEVTFGECTCEDFAECTYTRKHRGTMNSIFDDATETPCPMCLELATAGTIQSRAVMPLPQFPPRLKADNRQCCRDCQAAEALMRMGGHPKFGPSRLTVANDRLEGITMPPGMMELLGLCAMGYIHPCSDADLERHLDWLDRHGLLNSGRCEKSNTTEKTRRNHE